MSVTTTFRDVVLVEQDQDSADAGQDESALVWHGDYFDALSDFKKNRNFENVMRQQPCDGICQRMHRYWQQFGFMTSTSTLTRFRVWYKNNVCVLVDHHDTNQKNLVL